MDGRKKCAVLCTLTVCAIEEVCGGVRVEWITHAQHLHNYLAKQRAGKHPRDVILALFVVLLSVAANYLDGVRLWTPRGDATVHLEEA